MSLRLVGAAMLAIMVAAPALLWADGPMSPVRGLSNSQPKEAIVQVPSPSPPATATIAEPAAVADIPPMPAARSPVDPSSAHPGPTDPGPAEISKAAPEPADSAADADNKPAPAERPHKLQTRRAVARSHYRVSQVGAANRWSRRQYYYGRAALIGASSPYSPGFGPSPNASSGN